LNRTPLGAMLSAAMERPMPIARLIPALALVATLATCTSLSEDECQAGDWEGIGLADGAEGRGTERIEAHVRACAEAGVVPDTEAWLRGREKGLRLYCTPAKAYEVGRRGGSVQAGCTGAELSAMEPAYEHGRRYWQIALQIADIRSDIRAIDSNLLRARPSLFARRSMLISRLGVLEAQQRRYASWP
jgi:hypothetical protein